MLALINHGDYTLSKTINFTTILTLNRNHRFIWHYEKNAGEILTTALNPFPAETILSVGKYRQYDVKNEHGLTDTEHLELLVGEGRWQGYILPDGLPSHKDERSSIIPTKDLISRLSMQ